MMLLGPMCGFPQLAVVGFAAVMNGIVAGGLSSRPDGSYSRTVWWVAGLLSVVTLIITTAVEIHLWMDRKAFPKFAFLSVLLCGMLIRGQFRFLFRVKRDSKQFQLLVNQYLERASNTP